MQFKNIHLRVKLHAMKFISGIDTHLKNTLYKMPIEKDAIDCCPHFLPLACEKQEPIWGIRFPFTPFRKTLRVLI